MQFTITSLTLFLAATAAAMPAMQAPNEPLARRQSGTVGLGGACESRDDCVGDIACIAQDGGLICSRNLGLKQPCAVDADCNSNSCGPGENFGGQGVVVFECLARTDA